MKNQKISNANKGKKNHMYGKKHSEETKNKIRKIQKNRWKKGISTDKTYMKSQKYRNKMSEVKRKFWSKEENRNKQSQRFKGKHHSPDSEFKKGRKRTKQEKKKHSNSVKLSGNPNWINGVSFEKYLPEFNKELKGKIKRRDNYLCQECQTHQDNLKRELSIHHIDYNKKNNSEFNLISLCNKCHIKTNYNREHWKEYFQMKLFIKEFFNPQNILIFNKNKQIGEILIK